MLRVITVSQRLFVSASLSGSLSTSNSSLSGFTGLQNLGNNNIAATSMSPGVANGTSGMDALSQAYSGIQQYAGLSGLLSPATGKWLISILKHHPHKRVLKCTGVRDLVLLFWVDGQSFSIISIVSLNGVQCAVKLAQLCVQFDIYGCHKQSQNAI